jgi:hypothetical protein
VKENSATLGPDKRSRKSGINRGKAEFSEQDGREIGRKGKITVKCNSPVLAAHLPEPVSSSSHRNGGEL